MDLNVLDIVVCPLVVRGNMQIRFCLCGTNKAWYCRRVQLSLQEKCAQYHLLLVTELHVYMRINKMEIYFNENNI